MHEMTRINKGECQDLSADTKVMLMHARTNAHIHTQVCSHPHGHMQEMNADKNRILREKQPVFSTFMTHHVLSHLNL